MQTWALTNSQPAVENFWNANVMIKSEAWDTEGQMTVPGYCNATFLSHQKLVTAAHCLVHAQVMKKFDIEIHVGEYKYITRPDGQVVRVGYVTKERLTVSAQFHFLPSLARKIASQGFSTKVGPEEDMAVIELTELWGGQVPILFPKVLPKDKEALLQQNLSNQLVVLTVNFMEIASNDTKRNALLNVVSNSGAYFQSKSFPRVEEGDSGGALYYVEGNQYYLVGVVKGRAETYFSNWDVYSNVLPLLRTHGF